MRRKIKISLIVFCLVYISGYVLIRQMAQEVWEGDGKTYVIFPADRILYYFYRPLSYVDGAVTGMNFHFGAHK